MKEKQFISVVFIASLSNTIPTGVHFTLRDAHDILCKIEKNMIQANDEFNRDMVKFKITYINNNKEKVYFGKYYLGSNKLFGKERFLYHPFCVDKNLVDFMKKELQKENEIFEYTLYSNPKKLITVPFNELDTVLENIQKRDALQILFNKKKDTFVNKEPYKLKITKTSKKKWGPSYEENTVGNILQKYSCLLLDLSKTKVSASTIDMSYSFFCCSNIVKLPQIPISVTTIFSMIESCDLLNMCYNFKEIFINLSKTHIPILDIKKEIVSGMSVEEVKKLNLLFAELDAKGKIKQEKLLMKWKTQAAKKKINKVA